METIASNPGHCLFCDIVDEEHARQLVLRLTSTDMASGWGIRTVSSRSSKYNPMSYHNGSIWPHDNSLIVAGMRRYGSPTVVCPSFSVVSAATGRLTPPPQSIL